MIEEIRSRWDPDAPFTELIELSDKLDLQVRQIRSARNIKPPIIRCRRCGRVGPAGEPSVSVRAMILAASSFGIESRTVTKVVERKWAKYRAENELDIYDKPSESPKNCAHLANE